MKGRAVGLALLVSAVSTIALADNIRFRGGSHRGQWCDGNRVVYTLTTQESPNVWAGRLQNGTTLDRLRVEQFDDGSLHITRYLSGQHEGETQEITTRPPSVRVFDGQAFAQFWAARGVGPSCTGHNADLRMRYENE